MVARGNTRRSDRDKEEDSNKHRMRVKVTAVFVLNQAISYEDVGRGSGCIVPCIIYLST
jgi:hypothetical protein